MGSRKEDLKICSKCGNVYSVGGIVSKCPVCKDAFRNNIDW